MGDVRKGDIHTTPLKRIAVVGGDVLHAMKSEDIGYRGFGEAYFSQIEFGSIKAWKRHREMTLNLVVPIGNAFFVFYQEETGETTEFEIGESNYIRLTVPPGLWFGFQGISKPYSLLLNIANIPHDPLEVDRRALHEIKYAWRLLN